MASPSRSPSVAKNAIDWCSRPPADVPRVFRDKPVAIAGASPGGFGTVLSQNAWLPVFRTLGANLYPGKLLVSRAGNVFDANGNITDAAVRDSLPKFMARFIAFIGG
jgi:chromate reductase